MKKNRTKIDFVNQDVRGRKKLNKTGRAQSTPNASTNPRLRQSIDPIEKTTKNENLDLKKIHTSTKRRQRNIKKTISVIIIILTLFIITLAGQALITDKKIRTTISRLPVIGGIGRLIGANRKTLDGTRKGRTNILVLGVGGSGHEGPELSDTIMIVSINHESNEIGMTSIPRDLLAPIPGYGVRKINHANAFGEAESKGSGPILASETIEAILDIPIHYYIRVDFDAFETTVDALGGIDMYVPFSFSDPFYPLGPNQHETVSFTKGNHHFDGATALKYARSRYTTSDFDRAKRQQEILKALKEKSLKIQTWLSPSRVSTIWKAVNENITTNLSKNEIQALIGLLPKLQTEHIEQMVFSDAPDNYLYATTTSDGAFVLIPNENDYTHMQQAVNDMFGNSAVTQLSGGTVQPSSKKTRIIIHNGTRIAGLAGQTATILEQYAYTIIEIGNAKTQDHTKTTIYDLTNGEKPEKLAFLKGTLDAEIANLVPLSIVQEYKNQTDFFVILGSESNE